MSSNVATIEQPRQQMQAATPTPSTLLQMAVQQGADLDRLEKLMELQERWETNEARKAFHAAMAALKVQPLAIEKDKHVSFTTAKGTTAYDHATLGNVVRVIAPALAAQGLSHAWITERMDGGRIKVTCKITHALGHSESITLDAAPDDSGGKNNIQALGSAVSYLQRYTLLAITGLATEDQDDDGRDAEKPAATVTDVQEAKIRELLEATGSDVPRFLEYMQVAKISDIPASHFDRATRPLMQKLRAKGGAK